MMATSASDQAGRQAMPAMEQEYSRGTGEPEGREAGREAVGESLAGPDSFNDVGDDGVAVSYPGPGRKKDA